MAIGSKIKVLVVALLIVVPWGLATAFQDPNQSTESITPAGTIISVRAEGSYVSETGEVITTVSATMTLTVGAVAGLVVTPDDSAPSSFITPRERVTKLFRVCNTGNVSESFTLSHAEITAPASLDAFYFDLDADGIVSSGDTKVTVGSTTTPLVGADRCLGVLAVADINDAAVGSRVALQIKARASAEAATGNAAEDQGTSIYQVGTGPVLSSPLNAQQGPLMLVDGKERITATSGQSLSYSISFTNSGDAPAHNVLVVDDLPANLDYVPNSLALGSQYFSDAYDNDGANFVDRHCEVRIKQVAPGETVEIRFRARLSAKTIPGLGTVNKAFITAQNLRDARPTSDAVVMSDPFGVVYAARSGGAVKVSGAKVIISTDQLGHNPVLLPAASGVAPNAKNDNPFVTGAAGDFNFALSPSQVGTADQPATYFISVQAPNFKRRSLQVTVRPRGHDLYSLTVRAIDDQPIAEGGSFTLTREAVQLDDLAFVVLNIPLFETTTFELSKVADKQRAEIGDVVSYRVTAHNALASPLTDVVLRDRLPVSFHYAPGTARVETATGGARAIEPEIAGNEMLFRLGQVGAGERAIIVYRVRVGVNAVAGEQFNTAMAEGVSALQERIATATARAGVVVSSGVFSMQRPIIGRVFADANGDGEFDEGDRPLPAVRLYLSNGDSVTTDSQGMYNFPLVNEGSVTIALDPITVPRGHKLVSSNGRAERGWSRLLRTPLGGGALLRQNFALLPSDLASNREPADRSGLLATTVTTSGTTQAQALAAGTYELAAGDNVAPIAPGDVRIDSPAPAKVILSAMRLEVTVAQGWTSAVELNGERVRDSLIGERRVDHKNKVSSYIFIGINVRPGSNRIKVTAISPQGQPGNSTEVIVYGRGPVKRLELAPEKKDLPANGRDRMLVQVRGFDQWNHPAADDQVLVEVSSGALTSEACANQATGQCSGAINLPVGAASRQQGLISGSNVRVESASEKRNVQINSDSRQVKLSLTAGEARFYLVAANEPGNAELHAHTGNIETQTTVRYLPEMRRPILVAMAEATFGSAAPDREWQSVRGNTSNRLSFFYRGTVFGTNLLTLAYDSHRPFHRTAERDRLYELDARDRVYPLFGDSSTRFEEARSNSKLYLRFDRGASFAMFGDFNPEQDGSDSSNSSTNNPVTTRTLTGYSRNLTGVKLHLDNGRGDSITVTGARPDTTFARDVFPGGSFGLLQLSNTEVLPGSETVVIEVRDRRNPEVVISREPLSRSIDYNLDANTGVIFLLRPVSTFDFQLNLIQILVTYEHSARGLASAVYTARATKQFNKLGLRVGASFVNQRQPELGAFYLGGIDIAKKLPRNGTLQLEFGMSRGRVGTTGNLLASEQENANGDGGNAYHAELTQPLPFYDGVLKARITQADSSFVNPFGPTVASGSRRAVASLEFKVRPSSLLKFGVGQERNKTETVNNQRLTASVAWTEQLTNRLRFNTAYDFRKLDGVGEKEITSHLLTIGADWKPTDKLTLSVKREQNLGEADPTYPNQTTLSATYQVDSLTRLFFTQRLASAPIVPISDVSKIGFGSTGTRNEMAFGVETKLGRFTTANSRYQIENGINGNDSFAVIGLVNRLPLNDKLSLELGFERGQHLSGQGSSFNNGSFGFSWVPTKNFRSAARYELRDRNGFGQAFTLAAAGKINDDITTLGSIQWTRSDLAGNWNSTMSGTAAFALRPLHSDRVVVLFSYNRRSVLQKAGTDFATTVDHSDTLSADGLLALTKRVELYGRFAARSSESGRQDLERVSTFTYMAQGRVQNRLSDRFDVAAELRWLVQPASNTRRASVGTELGYWLLPDLRVGAGYNFTGLRDSSVNIGGGPGRRGFYFTISSKLSDLFNLFRTSENSEETTAATAFGDKQK